MAVVRLQMQPDRVEIEKPVNLAKEMVLWNVFFQAEIVEQLILLARTLTHHTSALPYRLLEGIISCRAEMLVCFSTESTQS